MLIKICKTCEGAGFYRIPVEELDPLTNMVAAKRIRTVESEACRFMIKAWEFECRPCRGTGAFEWTRGKSLTPA